MDKAKTKAAIAEALTESILKAHGGNFVGTAAMLSKFSRLDVVRIANMLQKHAAQRLREIEIEIATHHYFERAEQVNQLKQFRTLYAKIYDASRAAGILINEIAPPAERRPEGMDVAENVQTFIETVSVYISGGAPQGVIPPTLPHSLVPNLWENETTGEASPE